MVEQSYSADAILQSTSVLAEDAISSSVLIIRDYLRNNLTDPIAATRDSDKQFVLTNMTTRRVHYPHVIVYQYTGTGDRVGGNSWMFDIDMYYTFDVLALNVADLDTISGDLIYKIIQGLAALHDAGLQRARFLSLPRWNPMGGVRQVHRKTAEMSFHYHLAT